jgi:capsular polysaccharide biosynthesis protein
VDNQTEYDEWTFLDLLLILSASWKSLILGPIATGFIALGLSFVLPQTYRSQSILKLPVAATNQEKGTSVGSVTTAAQAAAMMTSPIVLDPVIQSLDLAEGKVLQDARSALASRVSATVGKDTLLRLDVDAKHPEEAQKIANAIIDSWLSSTKPGDQEQADLSKRLVATQKSLDGVNLMLDRLTTQGIKSLNQPLTRGESVTSLVALGELRNLYLTEVLTIPRLIKGLSRDVVLQPPTLPSKSIAPKKTLIAVIAALVAGLALIVFQLAKHAWVTGRSNPDVARKQSELLKNLGRR